MRAFWSGVNHSFVQFKSGISSFFGGFESILLNDLNFRMGQFARSFGGSRFGHRLHNRYLRNRMFHYHGDHWR